MKVEEGADFFVKEGYQPAAAGRGNAYRGTFDALDLYCTPGKLEIQKLAPRSGEATGLGI